MKYINKLSGIELNISIDELASLEEMANRQDFGTGASSSTDRLSDIAVMFLKLIKNIEN